MGGAVRYVAVGDSVARGFRLGAPRPAGARPLHGPLLGLLSLFDRPGAGYPARVAEILGARGARVDLDTSLTSSGATSGTLWRTDGPAARLRRVFGSPADVVTVTVGANDVMRPWAPYILASAPLRLVAGRARDLAPVLDPLAPPPEASAAALGRLRERLRALLECSAARGAPGSSSPVTTPGTGARSSTASSGRRSTRPSRRRPPGFRGCGSCPSSRCSPAGGRPAARAS